MTAPDVHLFQIAYSEKTRAELEPGYRMLDNLSNERPDWFEYWPIRRHLLTHLDDMDEQAFHGFFSPKFGRKTQRTHAQVVATVQAAAPRADVVLFSPQPDMGAFFLNVFEQGETFDPGLVAAFEQYLAHDGRPTSLAGLVMDARHVVFSNYFVARPAFWREWLAFNERFFAVCEGPDTALKALLTAPTTYPGAVQRKVFLMERTASLMLATEPRWRSVPDDPFTMAWSASRFRDYRHEAVMSDALKRAYRDTAFPEYLQAFGRLRAHFSEGRPPLA